MADGCREEAENIATKINDKSYKRYKLLSLSKTEYLVPKEVQMLSPSLKGFKTDTKAKNE